jgi:hypothetical protein
MVIANGAFLIAQFHCFKINFSQEDMVDESKETDLSAILQEGLVRFLLPKNTVAQPH